MAKLRIAVLFGGRSGEHEVSIRSAASVIRALDRGRYAVTPVAINKQGRWLGPADSVKLLPAEAQAELSTETAVTVSREPEATSGVDVVIPILHGTFGEDGTVQGLLELADVAYVGAGVLGSACGMDKDVMKRLFRERGLPTVEHIAVLRRDVEQRPNWIREQTEAHFRYPVFVKPANLGSSVGVSRADDAEGLRRALEEAALYDRKLVIERGVEGREIEVAVLGNDSPEASVAGEIIPTAGFYDYEAKYVNDSAKLAIPAELSEAQAAEVRRLAVAGFQAVECRGLARVDFFLESETGRFLLNEVNTMPGFTSISMYPKLWQASGVPYAELLDRLIALALEAHAEKKATRFEK
ncbi:MAG: D-alanine--D-alanine ligase family protein [Bryobacterales bacterium]